MKKEKLEKANEIQAKLDKLQRRQIIINNKDFFVRISSSTLHHEDQNITLDNDSNGYEAELLGEVKRCLESHLKNEISILKKEFAEL